VSLGVLEERPRNIARDDAGLDAGDGLPVSGGHDDRLTARGVHGVVWLSVRRSAHRPRTGRADDVIAAGLRTWAMR